MRSRANPDVYELDGLIASSGFSSGHRIVVGVWNSGPLGPMVDVMLADPSNKRLLIAPNERVAAFVSAIYEFDDVQILDDLTATADGHSLQLTSTRLKMQLESGRSIPIPLLALRPPLVTRFIESPIAKRLLKVETFGVTSRGITEWYRASRYQRVTRAHATLDGVDLGSIRPLTPPLRVGFSEPPLRPSIVSVRPRLHDPTARLSDLFGH